MTSYFFPSCKISAQFPEASRQLARYLGKYPDIEITGCCRLNHQKLTAGDKALVLCHTCANIIQENTPAQIEYIWQLIDRDESFPYPDYGGEEMVVQDCLLAAERPHMRGTVTSVVQKLNIRPIEPPKPDGEPFRCGLLLGAPSGDNARLAPEHFGPKAQLHRPMPPEERAQYFRSHCAKIATKRVVCFCRSCVDSINQGGKEAVHLLELLFPPENEK